MPTFTIFILCTCLSASATERWLTNGVFPPAFQATRLEMNRFGSVRADVVAEQLQVTCPRAGTANEIAVTWSADAPGHWPARDWQTRRMQPIGDEWKAILPIDSVHVPIVYFLAEREANGATNISPMRACLPRDLGMEQPSRLFWSFLDGFEQGQESWRALDESTRLSTTNTVRNGRSALATSVPPGRRSAVFGTTRLRGWFAAEHQARGISIWARTIEGSGDLRCTLHANAFSREQTVARQHAAIHVNQAWKRIEIPFSGFRAFEVRDLDFVSFDFTAPAGTTLVLDDLSIMGQWRTE